ncbi:MAG: hypothetical protein ABEI54_05425, partial [Candidatus Bipolaricaulia bacterium]
LETYREATEKGKMLLKTWLKAAESYKRTKEKMGDPGVYPEENISELRKARSLYSTAGDDYMYRKVSVVLNHISTPHVI